jgi:tRNA(fMet)-specific endonuclease VapC
VSWLLDTNTCSYVLKRQFGVSDRVRSHSPADLAVCSITVAEAWTGALKGRAPSRLLAAWEAFLAPYSDRIIPFDDVAAREYGKIRSHLEHTGTMIGDRDCMIAAIAKSRGLTVVTGNVGEFQRVPKLAVEDWRAT